jgi:uncharacterized protein
MPVHVGVPLRLTPDRWTLPFWDAAADHRLVVARCTKCGEFRSPPTPYCPACLNQEIDWFESSGVAELYTFTVIRRAPSPELKDSVPFVVGVVKLTDADGTKLFTNVVNCQPEDVHIGMKLNVVWDDVEPGRAVPRFEPRKP